MSPPTTNMFKIAARIEKTETASIPRCTLRERGISVAISTELLAEDYTVTWRNELILHRYVTGLYCIGLHCRFCEDLCEL